jgi:hypothetical protein
MILRHSITHRSSDKKFVSEFEVTSSIAAHNYCERSHTWYNQQRYE